MLHFLLFRGDFGRLGHGDCGDVFLPKPISGLNDINIVACACGDTHSLCVSSDGALYAFGRNSNGQLGNGTSEDSTMPQRVAALQVGSSSVLRELVCGTPTGSCEAARVRTWRCREAALHVGQPKLNVVVFVKVIQRRRVMSMWMWNQAAHATPCAGLHSCIGRRKGVNRAVNAVGSIPRQPTAAAQKRRSLFMLPAAAATTAAAAGHSFSRNPPGPAVCMCSADTLSSGAL